MLKYEQLIETSRGLDLHFHLIPVNNTDVSDSLRMSHKMYPWSLRYPEAEIVYNLLVSNNLKNGYEIATGFGISALVIAQALRITNGKIASMDAYVEESLGYCNYNHTTEIVNTNSPDGFNLANKMLIALNLSEYAELHIGWSPKDTNSILQKTHGDNKLDFAFIDGGHTPEQVILDLHEIMDRFNNNALILFHDYGCVGEDSKKFMQNMGFHKFMNYQTKFGLVAHARGSIVL